MFSMNNLSLYFPLSIETLMTDTVTYAIPLGQLGQFMHWLMVRKQLEDIFNYRKKKLEETFGKLEEEKD